MSWLWRHYTRLLNKHPFIVQCSTTGVLMGAGDFIAQVAVERRTIQDTYEPRRTLKYFAVGLCYGGPIFRTWYYTLAKMFPQSPPKVAVLKRVFMDQCIFAPVFILSFIAVVGFVRPDPWDEIKHKMKRDYRDIMVTNYIFWPAAQLINFHFVPLHHRVLVVNCYSILWNTFIAWKAERAVVKLQPELLSE